MEEFAVSLDAHTIKRMRQRHISIEEIENTALYGRVIQRYPQRRTEFPRDLRLLWTNGRPLHVVSEIDIFARVKYVKTVYRPSSHEWNSARDKRKRKGRP